MGVKSRMNGGSEERMHLNPLHELACFTLGLINILDVMGNLFLSPCSYKRFFLFFLASHVVHPGSPACLTHSFLMRT